MTGVQTCALPICTREKIESAAAIILEKAHAERWIEITVEVSEEHRYTQATASRPGKNSSFRRQTRKRFDLTRHIKLLALLPMAVSRIDPPHFQIN